MNLQIICLEMNASSYATREILDRLKSNLSQKEIELQNREVEDAAKRYFVTFQRPEIQAIGIRHKVLRQMDTDDTEDWLLGAEIVGAVIAALFFAWTFFF